MFFLLCIGLFSIISLTADANLDAMQTRLLEAYQLPLRWDNIESTPEWVAGEKPVTHAKWKLDAVTLKPGQETIVFLAPQQSLRLYNPDKAILPSDVQLLLSNGSGLAIEQQASLSRDYHSLLLVSHSNEPQWAHITRPNKDNKPITLGLFTSRVDTLSELAPYRKPLFLSGSKVLLKDKNYQLPELFNHLLTNQTTQFEMVGPARIQLITRLAYEPNATELFQDYRVSWQIDQQQSQRLHFFTAAESREVVTVNAGIKVVGRKENHYLEIPEGKHSITLEADRPVYLQLWQQQAEDYLFPALNQPKTSVSDIRDNKLLKPLPEINQIAQHAQQTAKSNYARENAMLARNALTQAALQRKDYPKVQNLADKLSAQHTFYRNLLPSKKSSTQAQYQAYFLAKTLVQNSWGDADVVLAEQHIEAAVKRLGNGFFNPVLTGSQQASQYTLPERTASSKLRVMVDKQDCYQRVFWLQYDQQNPIKLRLYCSENLSEQKMTLTEVALLHLQDSFEQNNQVTLGSAFSKLLSTGRLLDAASFTLALPAKVKNVKIWQDESSTQSFSVALQYRASKPFKLTEQSYLLHVKIAEHNRLWQLFKQALHNEGIAKTANENEAELVNEWQPLLRLIQAEYRHYQSLSSARMADPKQQLPKLELIKKQQQAKLAEQQQQWQLALSHWQGVVYGSVGVARDQAQLAQANALAQLDEVYLAKQLWRYLSLHASKTVAKQATQRLVDIYQRQQNNKALQNIAAAMLVRWPERKNLDFLFNHLIANQQYRPALLLGLTLVPQASIDQLLNISYQLKWWGSFEFYLAQLSSTQQKFWQGLKHQYDGDFQAALMAWDSQETGVWQQYLQQGIDLAETSIKPNDEDKDILARYQAWSDWQQQYPGDKIWRNEMRVVSDYAGSDGYYSIERDIYDTAFRATIERPVRLTVVGPAKLNLKIRVLHPAQKKNSALDGWVEIKDNQQHLVYPFTNNAPVQGLILSSETDYQLGRMETLEYQVGEGLHQIDLFSRQAPLSIKVERQYPAFPLTVLPELTLDSFNSFSTAQIKSGTIKPCALADAKAILIKQNKTQHTLLENCQRVKPTASVNSLLQAEQLPVSLSTALAVPVNRDSSLLANIDNLQQAQFAMMHYLLQVEAMPEINAGNDFLVSAEQLFIQHPDDPLIKSIWQRLSRSTIWQAHGNIINAAGMQFVEVKGWQPENTLLQTRKLLLETVRRDEHLLFGDNTYVFSMYNPSAIKLHASLRLLDVPFLPEMDAQLYYQLDEETPLQLDLSRQKTGKMLTLKIPKGQHQLRFYLPKPIGNQFVALRFDDHANDLAMQQERAYFVSTIRQPLQVHIQGPAMLRIDEWVNGTSNSHSHAVTKQGWQRLEFPPTAGKMESLFRVKQRIRIASIKKITNRIIERELVPVPVSQLIPEPLEKESLLHLHDAFQLGEQEDGTWSLGVDLQRRNNVQEDSNLSKPEQFAQYRLEHRYFDQALQAYWFSQGLARVREEGDPTFGLRETLFLQPDNWPFQVKLNAKTFVQIVDEAPEWLGQIDLALSKSYQLMKKTSLIPELSVFKRYLSLKNDGRLQNLEFQSQLDQDVYSPYKADHTQGLNTALSIRHRPWLDTLWLGRLATASNEDFNPFRPDYMSMQAQWRQYLDDFQLNAGYRVSFYQKDNDRSSSLSRSQLKLELNWQNWSVKQNRLELSFKYLYDIERKAHLPKLSMTIHFGEGRGYRDFRPGELDFLPLMQQRIPHEQNNRIEKNYP